MKPKISDNVDNMFLFLTCHKINHYISHIYNIGESARGLSYCICSVIEIIGKYFMKHVITLFVAFGLLVCAFITPSADSPCIKLGIECIGTGNILVVGTSEENVALLEIANAAATNFECICGRKAANTVIMPGGLISAEQLKVFEAASYSVALPKQSTADRVSFWV
jgi:hypothetical protein